MAKLTSQRQEFVRKLRQARARNVTNAGRLVQSEVRQLLQGGRTGRVYNVPGTARTYTASAPGEAPARRTGTLARSYKLVDDNALQGWVIVGSDAPYSRRLELGGTDSRGVRIAPRPHFKRAYMNRRDQVKRQLSRGVDD